MQTKTDDSPDVTWMVYEERQVSAWLDTEGAFNLITSLIVRRHSRLYKKAIGYLQDSCYRQLWEQEQEFPGMAQGWARLERFEKFGTCPGSAVPHECKEGNGRTQVSESGQGVQ